MLEVASLAWIGLFDLEKLDCLSHEKFERLA
jgi:hypothetical protein